MKRIVAVLAFVPLTFAVQLQRGTHALVEQGAVSQVVKLLQQMLDKSSQEGKDERELYAKFKCYCDEHEKEKTEAIATATKNIKLLESEVEELLGSNGVLSQEVATLKTDMDNNEQERTTALTLRNEQNAAFLAEKADLDAAVQQLTNAISTLAAIGADQALASAAHDRFMAGYNSGGNQTAMLFGLSSSLRRALLAAGARMQPTQRVHVEALMQQTKAPFTGTYVAQSGEVLGILKQIKTTFESNLKEAEAAEAAAAIAYAKWKQTKENEFNTMKAASDEKAGEMGTNDGDLSTKKQALSSAVETKESATAFLETLTPMCKDKSKDYEQRKMWRVQEEAVISEAIAILNSDHAFHSFSKVNATSFLQVGAQPETRKITLHKVLAVAQAGTPAGAYLEEVASKQHSARLHRIASMLVVGNPFEKVLGEIEKVQKVLAEEGAVDQETLDWCNTERDNAGESKRTKLQEIQTLGGQISQLEADIDHPDTGLKVSIKQINEELEGYASTMTEATAMRRSETEEYQTKVADCVSAAAVLEKASALLSKYYARLSEDKKLYYEGALLQEDPAPPAAWDGEYQGQSGEVGTNVVATIDLIRDNTVKEEQNLHDAEATAQNDFENLIQTTKTAEAGAQSRLVTAKKELAEKELELGEKRVDKDNTDAEVLALDRYLEEIAPGCDFITDNFDTRRANREAEVNALTQAVTMIKATPAYAQMEASAK